jgi:hypothetical protein
MQNACELTPQRTCVALQLERRRLCGVHRGQQLLLAGCARPECLEGKFELAPRADARKADGAAAQRVCCGGGGVRHRHGGGSACSQLGAVVAGEEAGGNLCACCRYRFALSALHSCVRGDVSSRSLARRRRLHPRAPICLRARACLTAVQQQRCGRASGCGLNSSRALGDAPASEMGGRRPFGNVYGCVTRPTRVAEWQRAAEAGAAWEVRWRRAAPRWRVARNPRPQFSHARPRCSRATHAGVRRAGVRGVAGRQRGDAGGA